MERQTESKPWHCKAWLEKMYVDKELSIRQLARLCNVDMKTIWYNLKKFGIERRHTWAKKGQFIQFRVPPYVFNAITRFSQAKRKSKSEIARDAMIGHLTREGFNPFKEK